MLEFLQALPDLGAQPQGYLRAGDFSLERMRGLMVALEHPQQRYPSIHVAGTNGKGSVSALCAAALRAAGFRVGLFTSPHLQSALAGISIDGKTSTVEELEDSFASLRLHLQAVAEGWTQFEVVTALTFQHFARAGVQAAVIEVGLGGRLDATNVLTPLVSVITSIDYDHTSILGETLAQIAAEKAGIIKPGVPVALAPQTSEARAVVREVAREKNAALLEVGKDVLFSSQGGDFSGQTLHVWNADSPNQKTELRIALLGAHQVENAATAFAALSLAAERGLAVDEAAIRGGFAAARWPGRFEVLQVQPTIVLDAAHSPHAARALGTALEDFFPGQPVTLMLGVSADKDLAGIIEPLRPRLAQVVATQSAHPRAMPATDLQQRLAALGVSAEALPDVAKALARATALAGESGLVLVAGSVFLVEQSRIILSGSA